jgi:ubiquilin
MGGMGGLGGGGGDLQQMYSQMMQNPQMVQQMMNNPMVQQMMNNPELLRTMMMSNPQIRQIVESNPEVGHILNDPDTLRQIMQAQSNPEIMRELQRTTDRAMSNIEAHPEGFNALRRLYTTIQEPLYEATQSQTQQATSTNPFASLLGGATTEPATTTPNAAPLPNPWAAGTIKLSRPFLPVCSSF